MNLTTQSFSARTLRRGLNIWPPFLFGGMRVLEWSDDWRHVRVRMKLAWYNRNFVGTQFGGNLFSMTDPFWMIMTMQALGDRKRREVPALVRHRSQNRRWRSDRARAQADLRAAQARQVAVSRRRWSCASAAQALNLGRTTHGPRMQGRPRIAMMHVLDSVPSPSDPSPCPASTCNGI